MRAVVLLITVVFVGFLSACSPHLDNLGTYQQYQKDTTAIKNYLAQNNIVATKLPSGIWFAIDAQGSGIRATYSDTISVTYKMKLIPSNTVADQSATSTDFRLSDLVPGVQIALPYFQRGAKGRIFIPSFYGYQTTVNGAIPANSNLIFDFNLINVKDYQLKVDTIGIDNYLSSHNINAFKDRSGLRYTVDTLGSGTSIPGITDSVSVKYSLKYFDGNVIQSQSTPIKVPLASLIMAWQIALPLVPEGSYMTLYVPSSLAYGSTTTGPSGILPNSSLVFNIKLVKVYHR